MRKPCYDCCIKHLSKAVVLSSETRLGYPQHSMYIIGNLSEAEDEICGFSVEIADAIRDVRLKYMVDMLYNIVPECEALYLEVLALKALSEPKTSPLP